MIHIHFGIRLIQLIYLNDRILYDLEKDNNEMSVFWNLKKSKRKENQMLVLKCLLWMF